MGKTYNFGTIKSVVSKAYIALSAAILADIIAKGAWLPAMRSFILENPSSTKTGILMSIANTLQVFLPPIAALFGYTLTPAKDIVPSKPKLNELNYINALSLQDEDAQRLSALSLELNNIRLSILDMLGQSAYRINVIDTLIGDIRDSQLLIQRAIFRSNDLNVTNQLNEALANISISFDNILFKLSYIFSNPSIRPTPDVMSGINEDMLIIIDSINNATKVIDEAAKNNLLLDKLAAAIVARNQDIYVDQFLNDGTITMTLYNIGDQSANVQVKMLENNVTSSYTSEVINIPARGSANFVLKPSLKQNANNTVATIVVNVNGIDIYSLETFIPLKKTEVYTATNGDIVVVSDGPVSFDGSKIKITNAKSLIIDIPENVAKPRFSVLLDGNLVRSGELRFDDFTLLGVSFKDFVSGTIEFKSIKQSVEYLQGPGSKTTSKGGVTIESSGNYSAQITLFDENPFPEASLEGAQNAKIVAIDLLSADQGFVTVKISFADLGINDPSQLHLYKYNATSERYQEFTNYQVDTNNKLVIFQLKPGDPTFALTNGEVKGGGATGGGNVFGNIFTGNLIQILIFAIIIAAIAGVAYYFYKKKK